MMKYFLAASLILPALLSGCQKAEEPEVDQSPSQVQDVSDQDSKSESDKINEYFEEIYQAELARSPMSQSYLGIKTDYDKWDDISDQKAKEDLEILRSHYKNLQNNYDIEKLDEQARMSYLLFEDSVKMAEESFKWRHHSFPATQMFGMHSDIPAFLINVHQISSKSDAEAYIKRLEGVRHLLGQFADKLKASQERGVIAPSFVFPYVKQDINNVLSGRPFDGSERQSPLFEDFQKKVAALELDEQAQKGLVERAAQALLTQVKPGYEALLEALESIEAQADSNMGVWRLPQGDEYYAHKLKENTTTDLTPEEVHQYGLSEVERIHGEMRAIMKRVNFDGSLQEFFKFMREDPQFYYPDSDEGRAAYLQKSIDYIDVINGRLDEVFNTKPKAGLVVKAVEPFRQESAGWAFYEQPAIDGSRPGTFYVNLFRMSDNPVYSAEALAYHEGNPGHHMQVAISQELQGIPKFRKFASGHTAYQEGWGLYSEYLPKEMGLYEDPYSDFGRLSMELWRAIRLVVDTGLHYKKWTREQTIDYHVENSPNAKEQAIRATERYIVMPGQATAYKIGMRKILELREMARARLGENFDVGEYHDVVLKNGSVPLSILEDNVNRWVDSKLSQ